ncbi:branched-chain amino acid transport system ATP-binding protein [Bradyrhizobium sp. USDA 4011]
MPHENICNLERADAALLVNELSSSYGSAAILKSVSFSVSSGEIVSVLGRNGAGKTTLLKTIMGLVRPEHGEIWLEGKRIDRLPANSISIAGLGYVPQGRAIFPNLSVIENLQVTQFAQGKGKERVDELIEMLPALKPHLGSRGGGLSGGQQQILALARALVGRPRVLLLDEPSEGIQPSILDTIIGVLKNLMSRESLAILLVEQNLDFAAALSRRAYVMDMGRIVRNVDQDELGASRELARNLMSAS